MVGQMKELLDRQMWQPMTELVLESIQNGALSGAQLLEFYAGFVQLLEPHCDPIKLIDIQMAVARESPDHNHSMDFLLNANLREKQRRQAQASAVDVRYALRLKVLLLGEGAVGKSSIVKHYCGELAGVKLDEVQYTATIGVDHKLRSTPIDTTIMGYRAEAKLNLWDFCGHPEFRELRNQSYAGTDAALLVYDVTSRRSFYAIESWLEDLRKFSESSHDLALVVVANKRDKQAGVQAVTTEEGSLWAKKHSAMFFETSVRSGQGIEEIFDAVCKKVVQLRQGQNDGSHVVF